MTICVKHFNQVYYKLMRLYVRDEVTRDYVSARLIVPRLIVSRSFVRIPYGHVDRI